MKLSFQLILPTPSGLERLRDFQRSLFIFRVLSQFLEKSCEIREKSLELVSKTKMASKDTSQILYEQLKCHICESGPKAGKSQWFQCSSQHQICQDCKLKEPKKCKCSKRISTEPSKVIQEFLKLKTMRFKCKNTSENGCQEALDEEAMILHETECIYRLVKCPCTGCKFKVPLRFHELFQHMEVNKQFWIHKGLKEIKCKISELHLDSGKFGTTPCKIDFDAKTFFSIFRAKKGVFCHWIHFLGSSIEAKKYAYTLEYNNDVNECKMGKLTFTGQVVPIDETADSIQADHNCLSVTFGFFKSHFINKDRKFIYSVKIRNLKEEAKDENVESGISDNE